MNKKPEYNFSEDHATFAPLLICACNASYFGRITPYPSPNENLDPKMESLASAQRRGWRPIPDSKEWACPDCSALSHGTEICKSLKGT